jgi:RHS repeat-associated protein
MRTPRGWRRHWIKQQRASHLTATRLFRRRTLGALWVAALATVVLVSVLPASASESSGAAAWGLNTDGQLGNDTTTTEKEAVAVKVLTEATAVAGGELHSLALLKTGKVMAWGDNVDGQLGNGTTTTEKEPVEVKGISEAVAIAAGADHSLALLKSGKVMAWGENNDGQLGNGTTTTEKEPVEVKGISEAVAIAAGSDHSLAVLKSGKIMAWGDNNDGQLGNGTTTTEKEPVEVKSVTEAVAVAGGEFHSLALLKSGKVMAWGENNDGQLGNGTTTTEKEPVEVKTITEAVAVAAGHSHSLAVLKSGKAMAWGDNNDGQLGNGTTTTEKEPVEVKTITEAVAVAGGEFHSLALLNSGKVMAWGENNDGQLGNGTTTTEKEPVEVKGLSGAVGGISAGANFSLASYATKPANTVLPTISGEAKDEKTLSASTGTWTGTPTITYSYQWESCNTAGESCTSISGATGSSYTIAHEEVGHTIRVKVTAKNSAGEASATSAQTATVAAAAPANTALPTISGEAKDEKTLTASTGTWTGTPTITYSYQWESCNTAGESCTSISGATGSSYTIAHEEVGHTIRVKVTAKNSAGEASATSAQTATVAAAAPANTALPTISGEAKDEKTLTASTGTWTGTPTITYSYQWESCNTAGESCTSISGATGSSYTIAHEEVGHTIRVKVTAKNSAGEASATSGATVVVNSGVAQGPFYYDYDADGQLKAVVSPASEAAVYSWDPAGNLTSIALKPAAKLAIIELAPSQGAVGETVTISGTGFSTITTKDTVKFNGTTATVTAATELSLTVKVPTGATSGTVTVQTSTEGPVTSTQSFTVASSLAPNVTSLSASLASPGAEVTISGSNFESSAYNDLVAVNRTRPELLSESSTAITFKVPSATGSGPVAVATPEGSATGPVLFIPPDSIPTTEVGATGELAVGGSTTAKVTSGTKNRALETFAGFAGQRVSLVVAEATYHGWVSVWGPEGTKLAESEEGYWSGESPELDGPLTLPVSGTYTILLEPSGEATGSVKLSAYSVTDVKGSITPTAEGSATAVSIGTPGQRALYTVAVTAGESVSLKTSSTSFPPGGTAIEWVNPEGKTIQTYSVEEAENRLLTQEKFATTGTYTLIVHPYGVSTGSMTLTAYNASDVTGTITPTTGGETRTVTIGVPGQYARYTFSGTEGQRVSLVLAESAYHGRVSLWKPEGTELTASEVSYWPENPTLDGPLTLPVTGTYTILLEPFEGATGSVKLSAYAVTDVKGSITPTTEGSATAVSIGTPGERALYTVAVTAGEAVSLRTSSTSFPPDGTVIEWVNPEGAPIKSYSLEENENKLLTQERFPTTGTYTLIVHPAGVSTGSMTLTAYNASDVTGTITPTTGGETKTITISVPGQYARYTFSGTEGQTVTLVAQEATIANGWLSVWNAEGTRVSSESKFSGSGATIEFTPSTTGTYTILIEPAEGDTGSVKLTAYLGSHMGVLRRPEGREVAATALLQLGGLDPASPTKTGLSPGDAGAQLEMMRRVPARVGKPSPRAVLHPRGSAARRVRATAASVGRRARTRTWLRRDQRTATVDAATTHTDDYAGGRANTMPAGISPEMRRFRPRDPAAWQPSNTGRGGQAAEPDGQASPWTKVSQLQGFFGATALSGQVLAQNGLPISGVHVAIAGTYLAAQTDEAGRFLLSGNVPVGHQVLVVEGESAHGRVRYGSYEIGVDIAAHKTTMLPYTIWLTPLDPAGDRRIEPASKRELRLTTPQIPGLEVRIPAGTAITNAAGHVVHRLNITAVPVARPPFPLPPFVEVPVYFTVQPGRAYLSKGAQIIYPNWRHLPPGERVEFWNYDAADHGWYVYGQGTVTANGKQIIPDPNVRVWQFTGAMINGTPAPPGHGPTSGAASWGSDPVNLGTGLYVYHKTDLVIPDTIPIVIERTYRQGDSNSYSFGIGATSVYDMRLWSEHNYVEADLILPNGGRVRYVRTSPGEGYAEAEYKSTSTPGIFYGSTIKWNGDGWNLSLTNGTVYVFGENAPLQAIRNRFGNQLTLTRESGQSGNITQITSPHGSWVKLTYNSASCVTEITDNIGRKLKYSYNGSGLLEKATDAAGRTTSYEYNAEHQLIAVTDGRGKTYIKTEYEAKGRVSKQTTGDSGTYSFSYTEGEGGSITSTTVTDPRKIERKMTFNSEGFPTSEIEALGTSIQQTTTFEPQAETGLPLSVTNPLGQKTTYKYESAGNITQETLLAGTSSAITLEYAYEPGTNELTSFTNGLKHTTTYHRGEHGELLSETNPLGHKITAEYNGEGQPTAVENALGKTTKLGYEFGNLTSATTPLGRTTKRFVNPAGQVGSITAPGGERTLYEYNPDNQLTKITDPLGATTSYEYDSDGDLISTTDPNKHQSSYAYDPMDLLESETDGLEHTTKAVYNEEGDIVELTDRNGKLSKFTYDGLDRLTEARFGVSGESAESTISYSYDAGDRLTKIVDSATGTYTPEYDELNRLKSLATPNGTISYEYNAADERTSMTVLGQEAVKYTYDEAGRLTEIKRGSQIVTFAYDAANLPTTITLPDGVEESYGYDEANELTSIAYTDGKTKLGELDYSYNADGLRESVSGSYARTGLPEEIGSASYNADNEQTERNSKKLSYNADGELTSDGTSEYKWNARGQLAEITGAIKAAFTYSPFGQRVSKTISGTTTKLLEDGRNVVQETQGSATTNLLTGLAPDKVYARTTSKATETLLTDALNSTIGIAGSTGKVETTYTYDPFGATTEEGTASENPFQYTGSENDGDGLYNDGARYYSPAAARFISQDPLGEEANGPNLYRYVDNSPTNAIDPYGTQLAAPTPGVPGAGGAGSVPPSGSGGGVGAGGTGAPGGANGSGTGGTGAPGGASGTGGGGAGASGGGFGPGPGGCNNPGKGGSLGGVATCRSYEKLEAAEEEVRREREEEGGKRPWEIVEETVKIAVPIIKGCLAGGAYGAYEGAFLAAPEAGAAVGCVAGGTAAYVTETNPFP